MRRVLAPMFLALLAVAALWLLSQRGHEQATGPETSSAPSASLLPAVPSTWPPTPAAPSSSTPFPVPPTASRSVVIEDPVEPEGTPVAPTEAVIPRDQKDKARLATYEQAAVAFLQAFSRPALSVTETQWWAKVRPHFSPSAAEVYSGTDPQMVPFTTVTGPAVILPTDAPRDLLILARVPTDAGYYRVEMETGVSGIRITRATPEPPQ